MGFWSTVHVSVICTYVYIPWVSQYNTLLPVSSYQIFFFNYIYAGISERNGYCLTGDTISDRQVCLVHMLPSFLIQSIPRLRICLSDKQALFVLLKFGLCWFVVREKHCLFAEKYCSNSAAEQEQLVSNQHSDPFFFKATMNWSAISTLQEATPALTPGASLKHFEKREKKVKL